MKNIAFSFDDLYKFVQSNIKDIIHNSQESDMTLSEYLDSIYLDNQPDCRGSTVQELLYRGAGVDVKDSKTQLSVFYDFSKREYLLPLFQSYMNDVYLSCFDSQDNTLKIADLCSKIYTRLGSYMSHDIRMDQYDFEMDSDMCEEQLIPYSNLILGKQAYELKKLAYGIEWTEEFARNAPCLVIDIIDFVKSIGEKHHNILLKNGINILLDGPTDNIIVSGDFHKSYGHHIDVDDFIKINNFYHNVNDFNVVLGSDGLILTYHNTIEIIKKLLNERNISNMLPNDQRLHITNIKHPNLAENKLVFFKSNTLKMITSKYMNLFHSENIPNAQILRNYFGTLYHFCRNPKQRVLTVSLSDTVK